MPARKFLRNLSCLRGKVLNKVLPNRHIYHSAPIVKHVVPAAPIIKSYAAPVVAGNGFDRQSHVG